MKKLVHAAFGLVIGINSTSSLANETTDHVPIIVVACKAFEQRASTFDCAAANAVKQGAVALDSDLSDLEKTILIRHRYQDLARQATEECGGRDLCRGAYGVIGNQCIAIAQSRTYSGFGSFMGRETTQIEAEATALYDCQFHVGEPGSECQVIVSQCPN